MENKKRRLSLFLIFWLATMIIVWITSWIFNLDDSDLRRIVFSHGSIALFSLSTFILLIISYVVVYFKPRLIIQVLTFLTIYLLFAYFSEIPIAVPSISFILISKFYTYKYIFVKLFSFRDDYVSDLDRRVQREQLEWSVDHQYGGTSNIHNRIERRLNELEALLNENATKAEQEDLATRGSRKDNDTTPNESKTNNHRRSPVRRKVSL